MLTDLASFAATGTADPDIRTVLDGLRGVTVGFRGQGCPWVPLGHALRREVRSRLARAVAGADPLAVPLVHGAVLPGTVVRVAPDGTVTLRMLGGHAAGTLAPRDRIPPRRRAGRLRPGDRAWVAVAAIRPDPHGGPIHLDVTQLDPEIPAGIWRWLWPDLAVRIRLRTVRRTPGMETVVAAGAVAGWRGDPVREAAGPDGMRVRRVGAALRGERITIIRDTGA